ncbi:MAG: presenilin family intramembrane aspartyl protease [Nanoarchaeota archaeon]
MKHNIPVVLWIAAFFLVAQFIGIAVIYSYIDINASQKEGKTQFRGLELAGQPMERPQWEESTSFAWMMFAVLVGTAIMFLLMRFQFRILWKFWYGLAVFTTLGLALAAFIPSTIAAMISFIVAVLKIFKPNWWVQNMSELFMYSGLAVIFVPIMNIYGAVMLLLLISIYDAYAVWKSKHMVTLAKFQAGSKMFAGLVMPYQDGRLKTDLPSDIEQRQVALDARSSKSPSKKESMTRTAILGGGDIGFPIIFNGVILKSWGIYPSFVVPFTATIALLYLFFRGEDGKFYPAMPFISFGCLIGLTIAYFV